MITEDQLEKCVIQCFQDTEIYAEVTTPEQRLNSKSPPVADKEVA